MKYSANIKSIQVLTASGHGAYLIIVDGTKLIVSCEVRNSDVPITF
tara:strand:+ start:456 stop:593 length:138 start_codon:yes stop_codon:yes gene_type:complete